MRAEEQRVSVREGNLPSLAIAIDRALRRLRIPSRHDIDRLNERIDKLTAAIKKQNGGGDPTSRSRKRRAAG